MIEFHNISLLRKTFFGQFLQGLNICFLKASPTLSQHVTPETHPETDPTAPPLEPVSLVSEHQKHHAMW